MNALEALDGVQVTVTLQPNTNVGDVVTLHLNGSPQATLIVDASALASGFVTFTLAGVPDGPVTVNADINGGTQGAPVGFTLDTVLDDLTVAPSDGTALSGTVEIGGSVTLSYGSVTVGAIVNPDGTWSYTPGVSIPGGTTISVTAMDAAGNSATIATIVGAPVVTIAEASDGLVNAIDGADGIQLLVALPGSAVIGDLLTINYSIGGIPQIPLLHVVAPGDLGGSVAVTIPAGLLADGAATVTASIGALTSAPLDFAIDITAPTPPVIVGISDNVAPVEGLVTIGAATNDTTPTLAGTAAPGATIAIFDNGSPTPIGTALADGSGNWSYTPAALAEGSHSFTVTATDDAGNVSPFSSAYTIIVDITPPAAPVIGTVIDDNAPVTGPIANGGITNDALPTITGSGANAGATVAIFDGGAPLGTTIADGAGNWSFTPLTPLGDGQHSFTANVTDSAGNVSTSGTYVVTIDSTPPTLPVILSISDDFPALSGVIPNGGLANDATPTLSGTADAGATVSIFDGAGLIGTVTASPSGAWTFTPATLSEGAHSFTASVTDTAGNVSASLAYAITIDTIAPAAPVIGGIIDDAAPVIGTVASGAIINDTTPTLTGSGAPAGATVTVFDGATQLGTALADGSGNWSFTPASGLGQGSHSFTAITSDSAGNVSAASGPFVVTIDSVAPAAPVITGITDDAAPITGAIGGGGITNDATPVLAGTAAAGMIVSIYDNGGAVPIGTATADGAGNWTFTPATLPDGPHSFTATATDAAGNVSTISGSFAITIDATPPTSVIAITAITDDTGTPADWITEDRTPTIGGTLSTALQAGERIEIRIDGSPTWVQATASGNSWFYGPGALALGSHSAEVRVVDAAGNIGTGASRAFSIVDVNNAPVVAATSSGLLGLISAEALGILDIGGQSRVAADADNNLTSVVVDFDGVLGLGARLAASTALAAELGLRVVEVYDPGILGLIASSSTLTITALDGGTMDNLAVNELLNTVHFDTNITLLGTGLLANVLSSTTITATDATSLSATTSMSSLIDASLLNFSTTTVFEGGAGIDIRTGTAANEQLYGHAGNDILSGGDGNDLLRGGAGADTLNGGAGNDLLIHDAADILIDGGSGFDTLRLDAGFNLVLDVSANVRNMERIDLGSGDAAHSLTLTVEGVLQATEASHQLTITGDASDSVTMSGALLQGQALIDGHAYNQYTFGTSTILVEDGVVVAA